MRLKTNLPMYVFTSQIPTLDFAEVGIDPVSVTVWAGRDKLLETTMYPVYGHIHLYDIGDLYEVATRTTIDYRFRCSLLSARQVQDGLSLSPQLLFST